MCRRTRSGPSWTKPYLEKEARWNWQKHHQNPAPTHKGWICRVFYMRIKALYKKSGKENGSKKRVQEIQNRQKPKETTA
jgi:hypothetical protein